LSYINPKKLEPIIAGILLLQNKNSSNIDRHALGKPTWTSSVVTQETATRVLVGATERQDNEACLGYNIGNN
jgi:hypothetical protein